MELDTLDICCNLVEIQYIKEMKDLLQLDDLNDYELRKFLFPSEWNYIMDKKLKLLALKEALDKKVILNETSYIIGYYKKL